MEVFVIIDELLEQATGEDNYIKLKNITDNMLSELPERSKSLEEENEILYYYKIKSMETEESYLTLSFDQLEPDTYNIDIWKLTLKDKDIIKKRIQTKKIFHINPKVVLMEYAKKLKKLI